MGRPEYVNHQEEFVTKEEYQEAYEVFQNELGAWVDKSDFSWRETTFQEKNRLGQKSSAGRTTTISKL